MVSASKKDKWLKVALLMSFGHFITDIFPGFLAPTIPLLMEKFGFSIAFAGIIAAVSSFSTSFTQPVFGYISDRINYRIFIIIGPLFAAVFYSIIGFMPNKWFLIAAVFFGGMGVAMFHPQAAKVTHLASGKKKGRAMSVFTTGGTIGYPLGALIITSVIVPFWGLRYAAVMIIPALIMIMVLTKFVGIRKESANKVTALPKPTFRQVLSIGIYVSIGSLRSLVIMSFNILIPIWYATQELSLQQGGYAIFMFHFFGGIGGLIGGFISDKISSKIFIALSFLISAPLLILFMNSSGIISYLILGLAGMFLYSSIPAVITQAMATMPVHMGTVSSMVMGFSWGIGGLLIPVVSKAAEIIGIADVLNIMAYFPLIGVALAMLLHLHKTEETQLPEYL